MSIDLKPCPFCGGEALFQTGCGKCGLVDRPTVYVFCKTCSASTRVFTDKECDGSFITKATDAWNRRADDDKG